jgi:predicted dehydrogenase
MEFDDVQVVAVCDVVTGSREYGHWFKNGWKGDYLGREPARLIVEDHYAEQKRAGTFKGCAAYNDFRDLLAGDEIDAVTVVTPDHWHAPISIMAARRGKHIYCEKPMTLTISEGRAMAEAVKRHGITFQTGSHERSSRVTRFGCELVRNGRIGKLKRIRTMVGLNNKTAPAADWKPMPVPDGFDYDMWLGPAPWAPYHKDRCLYNFRFGIDYSGGQTTNYGAHSNDMAQWGNNTDHTGPIEVEDMGGQWPRDGLFTTATKVHFRALYANGVELICKTGPYGVGARFEGTEGWVEIGYGGFRTHPESLKNSVIGPNEIHLYESNDHHRNFIDCIKNGRETAAPVEVGHRSVTVCHLGNIAMMLKRKLKWDPEAERFIGDDQANRMLSKPMRGPWHL